MYSPWGSKESDTSERLSLSYISLAYFLLENDISHNATPSFIVYDSRAQ